MEDPSLLDEIKEWLALYHDQPISTTALHLNLRDLALTHKRLKCIAAEWDDAYRTEWILNMTMNYTADQLVFLDESSKDEHVVLRRYGRTPSGLEAIHHVSLNQDLSESEAPEPLSWSDIESSFALSSLSWSEASPSSFENEEPLFSSSVSSPFEEDMF